MLERRIRRITWSTVVLIAACFSSGCYHAVIDSGRPQSGTHIEKKWAHGFLAGLVPPDVLETAQQCPNGIARVETQRSFLNMVAAALTSAIYTPVQIDVYCAAPAEDELDSVLRVDAAGRPQSLAPVDRSGTYYVEVVSEGAPGG